MLRTLAIGLLITLAPIASGQIVITEWMYNGAGDGSTGEYVEFTNVGTEPVDMTGWSYDDNSRVAGTIDLSGFGVVEPGQSVILTDETAVDFATVWGLDDVVIIGGNSANLGRNDEINLYDASDALVDRLTYGDEDFPGTVRTQARSCNIPASDYDYTEAQTTWVLASEGDGFGSIASTRGEIGSPGWIEGLSPCDFDADGDTDVDDFEILSCCTTGPLMPYDPPPAACPLNPDPDGLIAADLDGDNDVDLIDFAAFQECFSGNFQNPGSTEIILNGDSITVDGGGVTVDGTTATITISGTYTIHGTLNDGQIMVNSLDAEVVQLILAGANISNSTSAPIFIVSAGSVEVVLADQTSNLLYDATTYVYPNPEDDEPNASLFSKDTMTISGTGSLTVYGNYNDGITSKDELIITGGTINVIAVDDGIHGKDWLLIQGGDFTVTSGGDGLKSDNEDDLELGYITIENGTFDITSGGDAVAAQTDVTITGGDFTILSGGGHTVTIPDDLSAKGIKGLTSVMIEDGEFDIDAADDAVHSNNDIAISGGTLTIATGDDAIHADLTIRIDGGTINITDCFEGIESGDITVTDGDIDITSDDDAITADYNVIITGGDFTLTSGGGSHGTIPYDGSCKGVKGLTNVRIEGGTFVINTADDGVHTNNSITITGGDLTIATGDDGVHADSTLTIDGGSINVTESYEGIESPTITINNGTIRIMSSDDGVNCAGGIGSNNYLYIHGGYVAVNAQGDGIDVNGYITMTGGTVLVHGPTGNMNGAIDYDRTFNISGGFLVAAGSAGMAQAPSTTSTQRSVKITYASNRPAGSLVHIETVSGGTNVLTFAPAKYYRSVVVSCPQFTAGTQFYLYRDGSSTGTVTDGLYEGGVYTPGTRTNTFSTTSIVTNVSAP